MSVRIAEVNTSDDIMMENFGRAVLSCMEKVLSSMGYKVPRFAGCDLLVVMLSAPRRAAFVTGLPPVLFRGVWG